MSSTIPEIPADLLTRKAQWLMVAEDHSDLPSCVVVRRIRDILGPIERWEAENLQLATFAARGMLDGRAVLLNQTSCFYL